MLIACVVGARPNFVKIAPLIAEMKRQKISYWLIHTGQHYDSEVSEVFFKELEIPPPDAYLGVGSGAHGEQTGSALIKLEEELIKLRPDIVLVVGDVNSTLAGALAAVKLHIPVGHIEAGYRSFDRRMPEEINRVVVDSVSDYLFAPTEDAVENLRQEGIPEEKIHFVGNIMAETLLKNFERIKKRQAYKRFGLKPYGYAFATIHRPENVDGREKLGQIIEAMSKAPTPIVFPVHPRTAKNIAQFGLSLDGNIIATESLSYIDTLSLLDSACLVLTDSGGIQEEACILKTPCLTVRETTERVATVLIGANTLISNGMLGEHLSDLVLASEAVASRLGSPKIDNWQSSLPLWDEQVSKRIISCLTTRKTSE